MSPGNISFACTKAEAKIIQAIEERATAFAHTLGIDYPVLDASMDIAAVHCNGNPLRLEEFASAPQTDFSHDVLGIRRHIDRNTGKLQDCFSPRYSQS